jgi:hypothetical protein
MPDIRKRRRGAIPATPPSFSKALDQRIFRTEFVNVSRSILFERTHDFQEQIARPKIPAIATK